MEELTLQQAVEEFNRAAEIARHDLWLKGEEYDYEGYLIDVTTPWACGVEGEEVTSEGTD